MLSTSSTRPTNGNLRRAAAWDCPTIEMIKVWRDECFLYKGLAMFCSQHSLHLQSCIAVPRHRSVRFLESSRLDGRTEQTLKKFSLRLRILPASQGPEAQLSKLSYI